MATKKVEAQEEVKGTSNEQTIDIQAMIAEALKQQREEMTKAFEEKLEEVKTSKSNSSSLENGFCDEDFNANERIKVKNVDHSVINVKTGAGKHVTWSAHGDVRLMTVQDIFDAMGSPSKSLFTDPSLKVLDDKLAEYLELKEIYDVIEKTDDLEKFVKMDLDEMSRVLDKIPDGYKKTLTDELYLMNELNPDFIDSGRVKRLLQKKLPNLDLGLKTV